MAVATVFIPDGDYCSDENHLGCIFEKHFDVYHSCELYNKSIGRLTSFTVNGELRRAFRKCDDCIKNKVCDEGNGLVPDKDMRA